MRANTLHLGTWGNTTNGRFLKRSIALAVLLLTVILARGADGQVGPGGPGGGARKRYGANDDPLKLTPQAEYWAVWRRFKMSTDDLLKTIGATNTEAALLLRQIQTNAQFLDAKWNIWFKNHSRASEYSGKDDYLIGLRADIQLLTGARKARDGQKALTMIRDAALDVQIKADNCRHSSDGLGKQIRVKVHTKAGDQEIGGYEVYVVAKGMFDVKSAHDRFPRQSSPTDEKVLSPGGYAMWVRKKDFTSEPVMLRIGGAGQTHLAVDIAVPAEPALPTPNQ